MRRSGKCSDVGERSRWLAARRLIGKPRAGQTGAPLAELGAVLRMELDRGQDRGAIRVEWSPRVSARSLALQMQPLEELLHRIRWDAEFAKSTFALGYIDRIAGVEQIVPFTSVTFDPQRGGMLSVEDEDSMVRHIPLHRVRTVYKDGVVILQRPSPPDRD